MSEFWFDSNKVYYNCPEPQLYHCIICHKPSLCLDMFQDYSNKLFLSDKNVPGTIDVSSPYDSAIYGELPFYSWIAQNLRPQDWVSVHHYRRKLPLSIGFTLPVPIQMNGSMAQQLAYYHSPVLSDAINKTLTPYEQVLFNTPNQPLYAYNIMQAPVEFIQKQWLPYCLNKMNLLIQVLGKNYKPDASFFEPREGKRTDEWYQNRIGGFALERYHTLFWLQNAQLISQIKEIKLLESRAENLAQTHYK